VLTTLNLCDALGLTGLTISSDNNCLQITGEVKYEFVWGDYRNEETVATVGGGYDPFKIPDNDAEADGRDQDWNSKVEAYLTFVGTADTDVGPAKAVIKLKDVQERRVRNENNLGHNNVTDASFAVFTAPAVNPPALPIPGTVTGDGPDGMFGTADDTMRSPGVDGKLGTADDVVRTRGGAISGPASDPTAVPATAVVVNAGADGVAGNDDDLVRLAGPNAIQGDADDVFVTRRGAIDDYNNTTGVAGDDTGGPKFDEAYVAIGGATVLSAGKKGSIMNLNDDAPFNWLGLFQSEKVDTGVKWSKDLIKDGGHVIQLVHDFGNGLSGGVGLEQLDAVGAKAGTAVGVLAYAGEKVTAHVTVAAAGILDGTVENYGIHAGITGTFNILKVRGAVAADNTGYWNALASAEATFDMFKLAWSGEANRGTAAAVTDFGVGASAGITVTDGVTINLGGRYYQDNDAGMPDGWQVAAQVVAAVTETLTVTGEIGVFGVTPGTPLVDGTSSTDIYGKLQLAWAPGGGFTSSIAGEVHQNGAYKATFKAGKVIN
jgi:hypothetical protein